MARTAFPSGSRPGPAEQPATDDGGVGHASQNAITSRRRSVHQRSLLTRCAGLAGEEVGEAQGAQAMLLAEVDG
jgi:hypothetical protein